MVIPVKYRYNIQVKPITSTWLYYKSSRTIHKYRCGDAIIKF